MPDLPAKSIDSQEDQPLWFKQGRHIADVYSRSEDAEFILDDEVLVGGVAASWSDLEWRECDIPVADLGVTGATFEDFLAKLYEIDPAYEHDRKLKVGRWMEEVGGPKSALEMSPLLVTLRGQTITIEDGYHRLGIAHFEYGATSITAICGNASTLAAKNRVRPE